MRVGAAIAKVLCVAFAFLTTLTGVALATPLSLTRPPPDDCLNYMPAQLRPGALADWRDTLAVEHCDRLKRLWEISAIHSLGARPQFYEGAIHPRDLPADVRVSMPLLRVVFPERVFFDTAQAELRPEAWEVVRIIARNLQLEPPDVVLFVAGHTDYRGERDYNQRLSVERANAVADAILSTGVNVARVWRVGFGEDMPIRAGDYEEAWGENRRVEFLFAARAEAVAVWLADAQLDMLCQGRTAAEANDCVRTLDLRNDYVAVETTQRLLDVAPEGRRVTLNPRGTQRIIINPVNRRSSPVETD